MALVALLSGPRKLTDVAAPLNDWRTMAAAPDGFRRASIFGSGLRRTKNDTTGFCSSECDLQTLAARWPDRQRYETDGLIDAWI
jgi:hypothetical protein